MTLQAEIDKLNQRILPGIPDEILNLIASATRELARTDIVERALKKGDTAPSFILPDTGNEPVSSEELLSAGPLVLSFYRGGWCPYCNLELRALQEALPGIESRGARLVAVSPQLPDRSRSTKEKHDLEFPVLSDARNEVAGKFGLVFPLAEKLRSLYRKIGYDIPEYNGDESWELPIPATYVIAQDRTIVLGFVDVDYTNRLEPEEIVRALDVLQAV